MPLGDIIGQQVYGSSNSYGGSDYYPQKYTNYNTNSTGMNNYISNSNNGNFASIIFN